MINIKDVENTIIKGDCIEKLKEFPENSIDLIFADPPYNLQLQGELWRPNQTKVDAVTDDWDKYDSFEVYDEFSNAWIKECKRVLKPTGTIWIIGSYHNIFRVGKIMQDVGLWILNDILWIKTNPMPNFKGTRFNNAHETLIWASKNQDSRYTFNYKSLKIVNDDKQMRSDWYIPICLGEERIRINGEKAHSTQKPEELLHRIIISTSKTGDVILDPFMGSGTTGAIAKRLGRKYIGIEREEKYIKIANDRIAKEKPIEGKYLTYEVEAKKPKVPFGQLIESGFIKAGEKIYSQNKKHQAEILANASLRYDGSIGSIHNISAKILNKTANNGWDFWYVQRENGLKKIDMLRYEYIKKSTEENE